MLRRSTRPLLALLRPYHCHRLLLLYQQHYRNKRNYTKYHAHHAQDPLERKEWRRTRRFKFALLFRLLVLVVLDGVVVHRAVVHLVLHRPCVILYLYVVGLLTPDSCVSRKLIVKQRR